MLRDFPVDGDTAGRMQPYFNLLPSANPIKNLRTAALQLVINSFSSNWPLRTQNNNDKCKVETIKFR
jgi:hypothetical protein